MVRRRVKKVSSIWNAKYFLVFLFLLVAFSVAAVFLNPFSVIDLSSLHLPFSGYDTAQIQATCGGDVACQCGDQITTSRVLNSTDNLTRCNTGSFALQIGGNHVVLDCNKTIIAGSITNGINSIGAKKNLTIQNCIFDGFNGSVILFHGAGNGSRIINNNFTNFNFSSPPGANAIALSNDVWGVIIRDNIFKSNSSAETGISVTAALNLSITNNTFDGISTGVSISGPSTNNVTDVEISENRYINGGTALDLGNMIIKNVTVRNENFSTTGIQALVTQFITDSSVLRLINATPSVTALSLNGNTGFALMANVTPGIFVVMTLNGTVVEPVNILGPVQSWTPTQLNFTLSGSQPIMNYTLYTAYTSGGVYLYSSYNGSGVSPITASILNRTFTLNGSGVGFTWFRLTNGGNTLLSFQIDTTAPVVTNSTNLTYASTTRSVVLDVSTNENATCRYGPTNTTFASLTSAFNSTTNRTHTSNLTVSEGQRVTNYIICQDIFSTGINALNLTFTVNDTTVPVMTLISANGTYAVGTGSVLFNLSTNENASCRYDTTSASFASLANTFASTTNQSHTATLAVSAGSYTYHYACQDPFLNTNSVTQTNFTVAAAVVATRTTGSTEGGRSSSSSSSNTKETSPKNTSSADTSLAPEFTAYVGDEHYLAEENFVGTEDTVVSFALVDTTGDQQDHTLTFTEVNEEEGYVILTLESTPQEITLTLAESKEADLTGDDVSDVRVTLNGIENGEADVLFETIGENTVGFILTQASPEQAPSGFQKSVDTIRAFIFGKDTQLYFLLIFVLFCFGAGLLLRLLFRKPTVVSSPVQKTMKENYASFKVLQKLSLSGSLEQKKQALASVEQLRKQFTQSWLRTNTKIHYSTSVQIMHGFKISSSAIPEFSSQRLSSCTDIKSLSFLQVYFDTKDDLSSIISVLTFISGRPASDIVLVLPPVQGRVQYPERVAGLDYDKGYFRISASGLP